MFHARFIVLLRTFDIYKQKFNLLENTARPRGIWSASSKFRGLEIGMKVKPNTNFIGCTLDSTEQIQKYTR